MEGFAQNSVKQKKGSTAETVMNGFRVHSATSYGLTTQDTTNLLGGLPQKTLFDSLDVSWCGFNRYFWMEVRVKIKRGGAGPRCALPILDFQFSSNPGTFRLTILKYSLSGWKLEGHVV
ncbi:unnamed protein product [Sphenostylis stenocarpa]|uniref:Uncharacterized protein n=1 Tax=Sphenostylis stenocarpa TaxID=92480 RepID=A0AA86SV46_9FABA|nr:unnamed protein product [Sphenostylis stenocarpa]